jgi:hypothetical protein
MATFLVPGVADAAAWQVTPAPVTATPVSASTGWGLGADTSGNQFAARGSGRSWTTYRLPQIVAGSGASYTAVAASSATDAWVVGQRSVPGYNRHQPVMLHFDGTTWTPFTQPDDGVNERLFSVAVLGSSNVWAAGWSLLEHWDGQAWSKVSPPVPAGASSVSLQSLSASGGDLWALASARIGSNQVVYLLHYDGTRWSTTPPLAEPANHFWMTGSVSATSPTNAWVAVTDEDQNFDTAAIALHWDGSALRTVPMPTNGVAQTLTGIAARSATDAWAVGTSEFSYRDNAYRPAVYHFDGSAWSRVAFPVSNPYSAASQVAFVPGTATVWVAGADTSGSFIAVPG